MAARKKKTTRKTRSRAVAPILGRSDLALPREVEDEFAKYVNRDKATATSAGWPYASTQGGTPIMSVAGQPIGDEKGALEAVILGGLRGNFYYPGTFTPGKPTPPACYALAGPGWEPGEVETKLAPPTDLKSKQAATCAECRWNAFGSGTGNAKACKNTVRLAMLPANSGDFSKADGLMLSIPPTALKSWSGYVAPLAAIQRPVMSVITTIAKIPNTEKAGFRLEFHMKNAIQDIPTLRALRVRADGDGAAALAQPPPLGDAGDEAAGTAARGPRRRKVVKKGR